MPDSTRTATSPASNAPALAGKEGKAMATLRPINATSARANPMLRPMALAVTTIIPDSISHSALDSRTMTPTVFRFRRGRRPSRSAERALGSTIEEGHRRPKNDKRGDERPPLAR